MGTARTGPCLAAAFAGPTALWAPILAGGDGVRWIEPGRAPGPADQGMVEALMLCETFRRLESAIGRVAEARAAGEPYAALPTTDFSRPVVPAGPERLGVIAVQGVRRNDVGDPGRRLSTWGCGAGE